MLLEYLRLRQIRPDFDNVMNHFNLLRDDFRSTCKAFKITSHIAVISFNRPGPCFADFMSLRQQYFRKGILIKGMEYVGATTTRGAVSKLAYIGVSRT